MYLIKDLFGEAALRRACDNGWTPRFSVERDGWVPVFGVEERDGEIAIAGELPGLTREDIEINLENNVLTVSGEKRRVQEEDGQVGKYHLMERRFGRFSRSFALPRTVQADGITANFDNGVLTVRLPKAEEARIRKIEVSEATA